MNRTNVILLSALATFWICLGKLGIVIKNLDLSYEKIISFGILVLAITMFYIQIVASVRYCVSITMLYLVLEHCNRTIGKVNKVARTNGRFNNGQRFRESLCSSYLVISTFTCFVPLIWDSNPKWLLRLWLLDLSTIPWFFVAVSDTNRFVLHAILRDFVSFVKVGFNRFSSFFLPTKLTFECKLLMLDQYW